MKLPEERPGDRCDEFRQDARVSSKSWVRNFLGLAVFAFGSISVAAGQQPTQTSAAEPPAAQPAAAQAPATAEAAVDASKPATPQTPQQQLADDTAKLLILANELKAELDKSNKDTLSLGVIKKAEQVEKLAHKVRGEMKGQSAN